MTDIGNFLKRSAGDRHPAFKFENVGDTLVGTISEEPRIVSTPNMNNNTPEDKLVIAITNDAGQTFALWVKSGFMARAIWDACEKAGVDGVAEGGKLAVRFSDTRDTGKPQPAKVFEAEYQPPAPPTVGGSMLAGSAAKPAPADDLSSVI